ncbi:MAG TPA: bifunctional phosphoserine phosphatase/homoserine phosphotransferase ThrH [Spirochaetia bacterium]|nr:bifunctional phosphoserine phosphatase/homoserine phosphotransferase ThrH [Spirochaetia bacterium]
MHVVCLDVEGVLTPEIWIAFSEATGIEELRLTTRDIPDYDALMKRRLSILAEHGLKLTDIQRVIGGIDPLPGAREFLDALRSVTQVILLSDTFTQFASPLMEKLGRPTLFCNTLAVAEDGSIAGYTLRQKNGKYHAVVALKSIGFHVVAAGDSFNDLDMIKAADRGFLFNPPPAIEAGNPGIPCFRTYDDFRVAILNTIREL